MGPLKAALDQPGVSTAVFDACYFGAHFKKPTNIVGSLPSLSALNGRCRGGHWHDELRGTVKLGPGRHFWATSLAGAYSPCLCRSWRDLAVASASKAQAWRGADEAAARLMRWDTLLRSALRGDDKKIITGKLVLPVCPTEPHREWPADADRWGGYSKHIPPRQAGQPGNRVRAPEAGTRSRSAQAEGDQAKLQRN